MAITIQDFLERVNKYHPDLGKDYKGCDGIKTGDANQICTGIVSSLVPTMEVVQKTIELGANLLYVHEPTSYLTPDWPEWKANFTCDVYDKKIDLCKEHGIVIYRDHDHMHAHKPDSIFTGVLKYLGWQDFVTMEQPVPFGYTVEFPEPRELQDIYGDMIRTIGLKGLRYIGKPDMKIKKAAIAGHIYPDAFVEQHYCEDGSWTDYATEIIRAMEKTGVELILPGEIIEWTVASYIRDAAAQGKTAALINIGHFNWEELGARYAADWLGELAAGEAKVNYVPTGDIWNFA